MHTCMYMYIHYTCLVHYTGHVVANKLDYLPQNYFPQKNKQWCFHIHILDNGPRTKIVAENIGPPDQFCLKKMVRLENIGPTLIFM